MLDTTPHPDRLPAAPGVGYKPQHFAALLETPGPVRWIEVHAENYMGDGGRPLLLEFQFFADDALNRLAIHQHCRWLLNFQGS